MDAPVMTTLVAALPFLLAGAALGLFHFGALDWNVKLLTTDVRWRTAVAVFVARLVVTIAGFVLVARHGALPLLLAAAGLAAVRPILIRRAKAAP